MTESSNWRIQAASAGNIKTHNLHLLVDDQDNRMDQKAGRPQSAGSHSSEDSRQMDRSPTGNQSDDSLEAEMKYQEELKERLRAWFADLGMNPEGVLRDSLDEGDDDDLRDSLDDPNQLRREGTFVKDSDDQDDPQLQDSLDATQESNNNNEDLSLQDSLDGRQDNKVPGHSNEPTSQEIEDYDKTIDNHMVTYPAVDPTLKSIRQSSGGSNKSSGSKPSSRRNSRDSGNHSGSPKVTSGLVRLKDSPSHRRPRSGKRKDSGHDSRPQYGNDDQPKPVAIPGINTFSRDTTPAEGTKRERTRPKLLKTDSKIHRLDTGEEVRVEYISDDSGDEDMHFVDEKGSPVNNFGLPLDDRNAVDNTMQRQFRIKKPAPPKKPSPREQQILNARRTSSGKSSRSGSVTKIDNEQLGLLDNSQPQLVQEPVLAKTEAQQLGINDRTLPPKDAESPGSDSPNPVRVFRDVRVSSNTSGSGSASKKRGHGGSHSGGSASKKQSSADPYNDLRFDIDAVKKAAAEQEAALRLQSNSRDKQRTYSPPHVTDNRNNSGNTDDNKEEQTFDNMNQRQYQQQQQQQSSFGNADVASQPNRRPDDIDQYHTPSNVPQSSDAQWQDNHQYGGNGQQPWQQDYGNPPLQQPQAGIAMTQYPGMMQQPIRSQGHPGGQYLQSPPVTEQGQFFSYQHQQAPQQQFHQPMDGGYQQPMQYGIEPVATSYAQVFPQQSGFEPSVSHSYQQLDMAPSMQQSQQWQYQQQAAGYPPPHQQFQPSQPQNMYAGQVVQGSGQFNPGHPGFNPVMQQQQQFVEQYPNTVQHNAIQFQAPPNQQYRQPPPQSRVPFAQPGIPIPRRQVQSGPVFSRPPRQQPMRVGPNFIERNKQLQFGAPKRTYQQLYTMQKDTHTQTPPLNPNAPLPSISRENSQDTSEAVNTWADTTDDEMWTKQLIEEQKQMALLMRGHSDANLLGDPSNNIRTSHGTQASWSADHATAYARMQAQQQQVSPRSKVMFDDEMYSSFESQDLDLKSPRGQSYSHPNSKRTSPYPTLPGILSQKKGAQSPLRTSDPDGYLVKLQKAKQRPQYKAYTMKDYRNLKKDMRLGGLGPDAEVVAEKQDKVNRQRSYAKAVMEQNKKVLLQNNRIKPGNTSTTPTNRQADTPSRRNIAIEYAKNIPRPRIPTPPEQVHERLYGSTSRQQEEDHQEAVAMEMSRLEELKARHMKEKEEVDRFRTEIPT